MKRDMDLCRRILLEVESSPPGNYVQELPFAGEYDAGVVDEHVALLDRADFIEANITRFYGGGMAFLVKNLTWAGHDFLDAARDEGRWVQAKERLGASFDSVSFAVLKAMLEDIAKRALGL